MLKYFIGVLLVWQINRVLPILFTVALALQAIAGSAAAATIYVDDDGPGNYTTIQAALDDAVSGDTIMVSPGTYPGDITIAVPDLTLVSSSQYNAVIKATGNAFNLNANNIKVKNFNIIGSGSSSGYSGIADSSASCTIQNNKISNFHTGIGVHNGEGGGGGSIINNDIFDCGDGILLWSSSVNGISGNRISNCITGIDIVDSYGTRIYNNNFNNTLNVQFVDIQYWNTTKTSGKNIIGGPYLGGNYWATPAGDGFSQTHLDANGDGFAEVPYEMNDVNIDYLPLVNPRTEPAPVLPVANFKANIMQGHAPLSVTFTDLSQNAESRNWDFDNDGNVDSTAKSEVHVYTVPGAYIVNLTAVNKNGTSSKTAVITVLEEEEEEIDVLPVANFKANITSGNVPLSVLFTDLSQDATSRSWDVNNDGIEDSNKASFVYVYTSTGTHTAKLTAVNPNGTDSKTAVITVLEEEIEILPVADFSMDVTSGNAPLSVLFTDLSQDATSRSWDVNNDGIEDSNETSFVYTYTSTGTYTANLTAINANGTDSKTATIAVEKKSSGGSSGGGGGGGGSPEPAKNVEVKELSQVFITNGKAVKFDFTKEATCVVYVGFDAKKNAGKTTTIVEQLKNKSALVSELPSGEVYKSFNVWVGNSGYATSKNIENPVISFKVEKDWMQEYGVEPASITLNRYEEKVWAQLPANLTEEDDKYLYFTADTPGFASFAITGKSTLEGLDENSQISAENRSVGVMPSEEEGAEGAESDENSRNRNALLSVGIVIGALGVVGLLLKSMKN